MKPEEKEQTLNVLSKICLELKRRDIIFCHWKSNFHLSFAMRGEEDWDVLIEAERFNEFLAVINDVGAKLARPKDRRDQFGVFHYYVNDPASGTLVHIHCYCKILTGDSLVKSYRIPIEKMLLSNIREDLMPVPVKEAELVVFLIRNVIKTLSPIDLILLKRSKAYPSEELAWLMDGLDNLKFLELLTEYFPDISSSSALKFLECVKSEKYGLQMIRLALSLNSKLHRFRRYTWLKTQVLSVGILAQIIFRKFVLSLKYKNLETGGRIIAATGPQAVGKSTIIDHVTEWLGQELEVSSTHVGKPRPTILTLPVRLLLPSMRKIIPSQKSINVEIELEDKENGSRSVSYLHLVRKLVLAYERKKLLVRIFKEAANGKIIFCDRYPSDKLGAVDGSSFDDNLIAEQKSSLKRLLMSAERRQYRKICPPDLVLSFSVDTEEAIKRNRKRDKAGSQDDNYVKFRHAMRAQPTFDKSKVLEFDTSGSLDDTLVMVKQSIWENL